MSKFEHNKATFTLMETNKVICYVPLSCGFGYEHDSVFNDEFYIDLERETALTETTDWYLTSNVVASIYDFHTTYMKAAYAKLTNYRD